MKKLLSAVILAIMLCIGGSSVFAAGYDVILETNIVYDCIEDNYVDDTYDEYWRTWTYRNLISNFSNGYSVVYENCVAQTNDFVYYTTVSSSYLIDQNGNKVDIGDFDIIGAPSINDEMFQGQGTLSGRDTYFDAASARGLDIYGGVSVCKNDKYGYVCLSDGVRIPCEHPGGILRYDDNIFGVNPDYYLGQADYYIDASGKILLSNTDLSPVEYEHSTFMPSIKYLGNNVFAYFYGPGEANNPPKVKYLDADGKELSDYTPKLDLHRMYYEFDEEALKNYYQQDESLKLNDLQYLEGNCGIFPHEDANGKNGMLDKNANIIVPYIYDDFSGLQDGYCWAAKDGKWSLLKISTNEINVNVNDEALAFDQIPLIINGRTLAPLRAIFEALDATVEWDDATRTVTSVKGDKTISMTIGKNEMYKNGEMIWLDEAPQIIGERTLVPVRAIAEAFDCSVDWDSETNTVVIKN